MRTRRHHNTKGVRQIRRGKTRAQVEHIAKRIGVPYGSRPAPFEVWATMRPPDRWSLGHSGVCLWGTQHMAAENADVDEQVCLVRVEVLRILPLSPSAGGGTGQ